MKVLDEAPEPARDVSSRPPFRVLIVDDDHAVRSLCVASLVRAGVEVLEAEDGQRGLERALRERPDLVLLDVSMPVLDGFALAECLRGDVRTRALPFIFLTGELAPESRTKAYALGAAGFVTKPFDPHVVASLVTGLLARLHGSPEALTA